MALPPPSLESRSPKPELQHRPDTDHAEESEPTPPRLGQLKLSSLGSLDASKSPPVHLSAAALGREHYGAGSGGVGAVSPAESARSFASWNSERGSPSRLPEPPSTDTPKRKGGPSLSPVSSYPLSSASGGSPFFSASSPVNKLLRLPRGRSLRFFIDGDDGLGKENKEG